MDNVLLVLMCLDLKAPNPLQPRSELQGQNIRYLQDEDNRYQLLVAVLDPAQRATSAPVTGIELNGRKRRTYNSVLKEFQELSARFYDEHGFIDEPTSYNNERQGEVLNTMSLIGRDIYDLFQTDDGKNPVRYWLDKLLGSRQRPSKPPVTILTNDFGIPWFWLKREKESPFLCEVCFLGLLQLSAVGRATDPHQAPPGQKDKTYEALLIKGSTNLPFQDEELDTITSVLSKPDKSREWKDRLTRSFDAHRASTPDDIWKLLELGEEKLLDDFRIVHFSGHYSGKKLLLSGEQLPISVLHDMLGGSLLVLDGCNSASKLDAWADVEGLTSSLINKGALGCVVTVLPVKHDPIVSKILWEAFYKELRSEGSTVGQALGAARKKLKDHFDSIGSRNPTWAIYQLIGSPAVQLCDEEDEADG